MTRIKLGFLPLIAIVAIALTAATNSESIKKYSKSPYTCEQNVDLASANIWNSSIPGYVDYFNVDANEDALGTSPACFPGDAVRVCVVPQELVTIPDIVCNGTNLFCCAEIPDVQNPCTTRPNEIEVIIHCKEE